MFVSNIVWEGNENETYFRALKCEIWQSAIGQPGAGFELQRTNEDGGLSKQRDSEIYVW